MKQLADKCYAKPKRLTDNITEHKRIIHPYHWITTIHWETKTKNRSRSAEIKTAAISQYHIMLSKRMLKITTVDVGSAPVYRWILTYRKIYIINHNILCSPYIYKVFIPHKVAFLLD